MGRCWTLVLLLALVWLSCVDGARRVMPWMCLQRCNETVDDIQANLEQIEELSACLAAVSFERYNLGPNGTLIINSDLYPVGVDIKLLGLETYPMISSYPYPPEFLDWMRQLWRDPSIGAHFVQQLRAEAQTFGWTGYQVDWEPTATATPQDAADYASYLHLMAQQVVEPVGWFAALTACHTQLAPIRVVPTVATWNAIWNLTLIGQAGTYRVVTMSTYAQTFAKFSTYLTETLKYIGKPLLGVGIETWPNMDQDFEKRVDMMNTLGLSEMDIWKSPIPTGWLQGVAKFVRTPQCTAAVQRFGKRHAK